MVGYSPWGRKESETTERLHFTSCGFIRLEVWLRLMISNFFFFFFNDLNSEAWQAGPDREAGFFMWSPMLGFQVDKNMSFQNSHRVVFATFCCSK